VTASNPRHRVWVATDAEATTVGSVLAKLGEPLRAAVADGRVFLNAVRVHSEAQAVELGDRIEVYPPRSSSAEVQVLDERYGVVAALKPAGLPTEPDRHGRAASLVYRLAEQLRVAPTSLHALSRLDVGVSGVVLVARTAEGRKAALAARGQDRLVRRYVGIAARAPTPASGSWKQDLAGRRRHLERGQAAGRRASTRFACVARVDANRAELLVSGCDAEPALLALEPQTGRKHQLRRHASAAEVPLLGDRAYGGPSRLVHRNGQVQQLGRIALHAARVSWLSGAGSWTVEAAVAPALEELWVGLGGRGEDMSLALARELP
jgi:23S rRNA-/tRNA-specific pseudouridylate synthase